MLGAVPRHQPPALRVEGHHSFLEHVVGIQMPPRGARHVAELLVVHGAAGPVADQRRGARLHRMLGHVGHRRAYRHRVEPRQAGARLCQPVQAHVGKHPAAAGCRIEEPGGAPLVEVEARIVMDTAEEAAQRPAPEPLPGEQRARVVGGGVGHGKDAPGATRRLQHGPALLHRNRHRLLHQHVAAGLQGGCRHVAVQVVWQRHHGHVRPARQ